MRAVDYITNGFGSPELVRPSYGGSPRSIEQQIAVSIPFDAPASFANAAIATYKQYGIQGFNKTLQFIDAFENAERAISQLYPNFKLTMTGPGAGANFKRAIGSVLNTAASRVGLTPLSSAILNGIRQWIGSIPDSSTDPRSLPMPYWIAHLRSWVNNIH